MTPYLMIKVINRSNNKVIFERVITGVSFDSVPFAQIIQSLDFLYKSIEHTIIFDCSIIEPIKTIG